MYHDDPWCTLICVSYCSFMFIHNHEHQGRYFWLPLKGRHRHHYLVWMLFFSSRLRHLIAPASNTNSASCQAALVVVRFFPIKQDPKWYLRLGLEQLLRNIFGERFPKDSTAQSWRTVQLLHLDFLLQLSWQAKFNKRRNFLCAMPKNDNQKLKC